MTKRGQLSALCSEAVSAVSRRLRMPGAEKSRGTAQFKDSSSDGGDDKYYDKISENAKLLKKATGYDTDCVEGAADTLADLGIGDLKRVKRASGMSYTYKATAADGRLYYLEFGGLGYLEVVRADTLDGKVLWGVID